MNIKQSITSRLYPYIPDRLKLHIERKAVLKGERSECNDMERLKQLRSEVFEAESIAEYLQLAKDIFNIRQIDSEITAFIKKASEYTIEVVGEIGTCECGNLFLLTHAIKNVKKAVGVDLIFRRVKLFKNLTRPDLEIGFFQGGSTNRSIFRNVQQFLGNDKFDMLFIDGDHSYEGVKADFDKYKNLVNDGGLIVFHDIVPDITSRMNSDKRLSKADAGDVPIFWKEIKDQFKSYEFIEDTEQDGYGIGMIEYYAD